VHDHIISLRREVCAHKTSLTPGTIPKSNRKTKENHTVGTIPKSNRKTKENHTVGTIPKSNRKTKENHTVFFLFFLL
jgi:hypothetical protein